MIIKRKREVLKEGVNMKKMIKLICVVVLILCLLVTSVSLYIGNYLYDYTLNPYSDYSLLQQLALDEEKKENAKAWMDENSQDVYITNKENLKLHAYSIEQKSDIYMIMVHGYRGEGLGLISPIKKMKKKGYNILVPDLRGHGLSEGDYIAMGWDDRLDIMEWIDFILSQNKNANIILYGVSMGGATVMNVAGEKLPIQVKAIIEDCGYTSVWDIFKDHIDMEPWQSELALHVASLVTKMRAGYYLSDVQPIEQVKKSHTPILFIHGDQDDFVPFDMLDELYNAASCPKEKLVIHGAGHGDCDWVDGDLYYGTIDRFIKKYT